MLKTKTELEELKQTARNMKEKEIENLQETIVIKRKSEGKSYFKLRKRGWVFKGAKKKKMKRKNWCQVA